MVLSLTSAIGSLFFCVVAIVASPFPVIVSHRLRETFSRNFHSVRTFPSIDQAVADQDDQGIDWRETVVSGVKDPTDQLIAEHPDNFDTSFRDDFHVIGIISALLHVESLAERNFPTEISVRRDNLVTLSNTMLVHCFHLSL
jgi:hypothetical protein